LPKKAAQESEAAKGGSKSKIVIQVTPPPQQQSAHKHKSSSSQSIIREDRNGNKILGKRQIRKPQRFEPEGSQSESYGRSGHVIRLKNLASSMSERREGEGENEFSSKLEERKSGFTVKIATNQKSENHVNYLSYAANMIQGQN
jgi:hypothetical protein